MSLNDDRGVARDGRKTTATRFVVTREERELLVNLVTRHKAVIENKRTDALDKRAKDSAWEKLTSEYNSQPGIRRVTGAQLRKLWDNEKSRWKKKQSEEKQHFRTLGGGPSTCGPMSPSLALVGAVASHMGTRLQNPHDSDGVHLNQPVLSLSPSRIFERMLTGSQGNREELLDETIQPQLRPSEGAGSPGPQTTQSPTEGACASCPSHTLTVVAPGNEKSQKTAVAPEENGENLVGAGERQRPKSTRSRLAAIERVPTPEVAARMEALKTDEQRKQELHKMQVQLLEQQLEQQKWHFKIKRQKLLFQLQEKQQQRIETQLEQK
nr:uncharacterized protein LOC119161766 [Rhipicephalus microplus]